MRPKVLPCGSSRAFLNFATIARACVDLELRACASWMAEPEAWPRPDCSVPSEGALRTLPPGPRSRSPSEDNGPGIRLRRVAAAPV